MVFQRQASVMKSDWEAQEEAKVPCGVWGDAVSSCHSMEQPVPLF